MQILKADTPTTVLLGPFVDRDDGVTPETGVDLATADAAQIFKHGASTPVDIAGRAFAHVGGGWYALDLEASDLDTEGRLTVIVRDDDLCLPVWSAFMVMGADVFDTLYADTDGGGLARAGAGGETLETLATQIDALPSAGDGAVAVNHDTGGADALAYRTESGAGIDNATVRAYLSSDYNAGNRGEAFVRGTTSTNALGRWRRDLRLDPGAYTIVFGVQGRYGPDTAVVTVA